MEIKNRFDTVFKRLKETNFDENTLCAEFWRKILKLNENFNEKDCWELFTDNIQWMIIKGVVGTNEIVDWFDESDLNSHGIYSKGEHEIVNDFAIGLGNVKLKAAGHSRVILFDSAFCKGFDTTFISGYHSSYFEITDCSGEAFHSCKVKAKGYSKIEAWGCSQVIAENYSYVIQHERASVANSLHSHTVIV